MKYLLNALAGLLFILVPVVTGAQPKPADADTAFNNASGTSFIPTDSVTVKKLARLGMLWGFIKYYHAHVNEGMYNMDAELCRLLPSVLAADGDFDRVMEQWVDHFGVPRECPDCPAVTDTSKVFLMPDYGYLFDTACFRPSLISKLDYIRRNRLKKGDHYYISTAPGVGNPEFCHEAAYKNCPYPDAGLRLLALYRFWNMIHYFYPARYLIPGDWNKALGDLIPEFCNAPDTLAYENACAHMVACIHDAHAQLRGAKRQRRSLGLNVIPLKAIFVGEQLVITGCKDTLGLQQKVQPGDIIAEINGTAVDTLISRCRATASASNHTGQLYRIWGYYLSTTNDTSVTLTIVRGGKKIHAIIPAFDPFKISYAHATYTQDTAFKILDGNIGYIFPGKLTGTELDTIRRLMSNIKGIIIDLRCYPGTFMPFSYGNWLRKGNTPFVRFTKMNVDVPGKITRGGMERNGCDTGSCYNGRIAIIANHASISQSEYTVMALSGPNTTVLGDTTAGADGNVSFIMLPGNLQTLISGLGVFYPDGRETQQAGIRIDKTVRPTIEGIRNGRDEELEAAISYIKQ